MAGQVSTRPPLPRNVWVLGFVSLLMDLSSEIYHALLPAFVAIGLMWWFASDIRAVYWVAVIPAACSFLLSWLALREPERHLAPLKRSPFFAGFKQLDRETKRLLAVGFLFGLARFSEAFLILKGIEIGLSEA